VLTPRFVPRTTEARLFSSGSGAREFPAAVGFTGWTCCRPPLCVGRPACLAGRAHVRPAAADPGEVSLPARPGRSWTSSSTCASAPRPTASGRDRARRRRPAGAFYISSEGLGQRLHVARGTGSTGYYPPASRPTHPPAEARRQSRLTRTLGISWADVPAATGQPPPAPASPPRTPCTSPRRRSTAGA